MAAVNLAQVSLSADQRAVVVWCCRALGLTTVAADNALQALFFASPTRCSATANDFSLEPAIEPEVSHRPLTPIDGVPWNLYPVASKVACFALVAADEEICAPTNPAGSTPFVAARSATSEGV